MLRGISHTLRGSYLITSCLVPSYHSHASLWPGTGWHLFLKALLTMAFSSSLSPTWEGPRKVNMSMVRKVGWAWHKRLQRERHCEVNATWVFTRVVMCKSLSSKCMPYGKLHVLTNSLQFPWGKKFSFNKWAFFRSHYFHFGERGYP